MNKHVNLTCSFRRSLKRGGSPSYGDFLLTWGRGGGGGGGLQLRLAPYLWVLFINTES